METRIYIDGTPISVPEGFPVRKAALKNGIYIPGICGHPDLPPARQVRWAEVVHRGDEVIECECAGEIAGDYGNCNLCLIAVAGEPELARACEMKAKEGLRVRTQGEDISRARREALAKILAHHPHACLTCAQREGCSLTQCSSNVPENERCCPLLGRCELGKIVDYIGVPEGVPKYVLEGFPKIFDDPFFDRDYNLCISCLRCVRICQDVREAGVLGAALKDGRVWVGAVSGASLKDANCRFCGACVEVCPTGALRDKPDSEPVRPGAKPPCVEACPAGIDIPAYVRRTAEGDFAGALEVVRSSVPFPGILGYVCFHPCEEACKREKLDHSIAICALKRFLCDNVPVEQIPITEKKPARGGKVAVVGSGPAGLTTAYYLARAGHRVDVYESAQAPGGMLRNAIPEYRLPKLVLDDELEKLSSLGVEFHTDLKLGEDINIDDLLNDGFDAVLLATGTVLPRSLNIPGEKLKGVHQALELLKSVRYGEPPRLNGKVLVIGGGNAAVDSAMTARRIGAEKATMVCLETGSEIPAHSFELANAREEGIEMAPGWGPMEFRGTDSGEFKSARFKRCLRVFDDEGRFAPEYDENETMEIEADAVIIAIGQSVERALFDSVEGMDLNPDGTIKADKETLQTSIPKLYAAGDAVEGPESVIRAIASGRKAADSIDRALGGTGIKTGPKPDTVRDNPCLGADEDFHRREPVKSERLSPEERVRGFEVIECGLTAEEAAAEAMRCLRCHLRATITTAPLPPDKWQALNRENAASIPSAEGIYQLADASKKVTKIAGAQDIRAALEEEVEIQPEGTLFCWEEDHMYSKRESELIQRHLQEYGEMPSGGGDDDLNNLF